GRNLRVGLIAAAGVQRARRAAEVVRAALGHDVDLHARGLNARIGAAGRDLHFLERVEVVVRRGRTGGGEVGDVDAVDVPRRLRADRAFGNVDRLLAGLVSADV